MPWPRNCVISEISRTPAVAADIDANPSVHTTEATETESAKFRVFSAKPYTLSIIDNIKFLENIKQWFKRTISAKNIGLKLNVLKTTICIIWLIQYLWILIFMDDNLGRNPFDKYYMPLVKIKDFNVLINNKLLFDQSVKNKQEAHQDLLKCQEVTRRYNKKLLLDYLYHKNI